MFCSVLGTCTCSVPCWVLVRVLFRVGYLYVFCSVLFLPTTRHLNNTVSTNINGITGTEQDYLRQLVHSITRPKLFHNSLNNYNNYNSKWGLLQRLQELVFVIAPGAQHSTTIAARTGPTRPDACPRLLYICRTKTSASRWQPLQPPPKHEPLHPPSKQFVLR
jgi:hypothetical protein